MHVCVANYVLYACVCVCVYSRATKLVNTINNNKQSDVKMKIAPVKVIIRDNILTQISPNEPMLFNIRKFTNDELEPLKNNRNLDNCWS